MNLGLVMMVASRSSRLRARFCATVPSPSASIGVHNLRNWISASIGASPPASRAFCSSSSPIGASSGPKSGAFSSSSPFGSSSAQSKVVKKRMMFKQLSNLSETQGTTAVEETLELFRKEDETSFTKSDLVRWAKLLYKKGKIHHAAQIFVWMRKNNMPFSRSEIVIHLDLIFKTNGLVFALVYYWKLPLELRSDKAYSLITDYYSSKGYEDKENPYLYVFDSPPEGTSGPFNFLDIKNEEWLHRSRVISSKTLGPLHGSIVANVVAKIVPTVVTIMQKVDGGYRMGSGTIVCDRGTILTCAHTFSGTNQILVRLHDKSIKSAKLVLLNKGADIAVLKIFTPVPLPSVTLGVSSGLCSGDLVVAVGTPLAIEHFDSVTFGIVGHKGRQLADGRTMIQLTCAINGGNSGGPIVNMSGEQIGVLIKGQCWYARKLGFAISIDSALHLIRDML